MYLRRALSGLVCLHVLITSAWAGSWREDIWHFVCPDSPFYASERKDRQSAGVLTSNGGFAMMVLGDPSQGALVSVNVPGETVQGRITSTLIMPSGTILTRTVTAEELWAVRTDDNLSVTYTFRVDPNDVEKFQAGRRWHVKAGDTLSVIPLKGSRVAIDTALAARDRQASATHQRP